MFGCVTVFDLSRLMGNALSICGHAKRVQKTCFVGFWLVVSKIYVASAVYQPYRDLEAGDDQSLKIQLARPGIEPQSSCSASQKLNHSATAAFKKLFSHAVRLFLENDMFSPWINFTLCGMGNNIKLMTLFLSVSRGSLSFLRAKCGKSPLRFYRFSL